MPLAHASCLPRTQNTKYALSPVQKHVCAAERREQQQQKAVGRTLCFLPSLN